MEILLVVRDKLVRDQVKVGLQQFPELHVTVGEGYAAINGARQNQYDLIFLAIEPQTQDGMRLLQHLRSFDRTTEVVIITTERYSRDLTAEKTRLGIASFLTTPIDVAEFFRLVGRLRARRKERELQRK